LQVSPGLAVDDVNTAVALTCDEDAIAVEDSVHRLSSDRKRRLLGQ